MPQADSLMPHTFSTAKIRSQGIWISDTPIVVHGREFEDEPTLVEGLTRVKALRPPF